MEDFTMHVLIQRRTSTLKDYGCGYFIWKDEFRLRLSSSLGPSIPPSSSSGVRSSTRPSRSAPSIGNTFGSNCKLLAMKIKILEVRLDMERHPEDHACQSAAIRQVILNDMENLRVE
ncbi:hypothetical protein Tco_0409776 [Tanacetum coccineum]